MTVAPSATNEDRRHDRPRVSSDEVRSTELVEAGMDGVRLNFSHGTHDGPRR